MLDRFWDPQGKYVAGFLKEYGHWSLEVSYRQHTLGCFILFCKQRVERISCLLPTVLVELSEIMAEIESALEMNSLFMPDRFNYCQLGNALPHLHIHGIPRYASPRIFADNEWVDATWGHPVIWLAQETEVNLVHQVHQAMLTSLA